MLAVNVEVWPGGDIRRRRVIHTISLSNESDLAEESEYSLYIDGEASLEMVKHNRSEGALRLLFKALQDAGYGD